MQGALVIEYPFDHRFESLHIVYDGVNGQLPNLDLINTAVSIAGGQMGIGTSLQEMWEHDDSYEKRLETMLRGMAKQGLGLAAGAHSSFIPYHIDAITLQTKGNGWQDEMALGRTVEGLCRSLNNLLEHLHQSFFFYLLMHTNRFVSIGTYLPSAMLVAANFTIMAVALWLRTGYEDKLAAKKQTATNNTKGEAMTTADTGLNGVSERKLSVPLTVVAVLHFLGIAPLYILTNVSSQVSSTLSSDHGFILTMTVLPPRNLRHPPPNTRPPIPHQPRTLQTIHPSATNLLPPQIFFVVAPRLVPECTCNTQLLAFVYYRSALRAVEFCADSSCNDKKIICNYGLLVDTVRAA